MRRRHFSNGGFTGRHLRIIEDVPLPHVRGIGLGKMLIQKCIEFAKEAGYKNIYLETMAELQQALITYAKFGFQYIDHPLGNSGHFGCDLWMLKKL